MEKDAEAVRSNRVRRLFEARYTKKRTWDDVLAFHGWLYKRYPHLLRKPTNDGDPYHELKLDLHGLYDDV
jgi:hypothetical protein